MRKSITIKNKKVEFENGESESLENIIIHIDKIGSIRADYLLQCILDYHGLPNWIAIHKKANKKLADKFKM